MRQTLFFIKNHEFAGLPVFGFGWLLLIWLACSLALLAWLVRKNGWNDENRGFLPFIGIAGLVIAFLLPELEVARQGLPIRGYHTAGRAGRVLAAFEASPASCGLGWVFPLGACAVEPRAP